MPTLSIPFQPLRKELYNSQELFGNFSENDPISYSKLHDFEIYRHYVSEGRSTPKDFFASMMQALHDNSITQSANEFLKGKKCVAIMGGHKLNRDSKQYSDVAKLSRTLTRSGFVVASGGGPGAMEATHLGAAISHEPDTFLDNAIETLSRSPELPHDLAKLVDKNGIPNSEVIQTVQHWFAPAMKVLRMIKKLGHSLAVPTWYYGHEPSSPFASHIAKYFQNSIREDGLLSIAQEGIIYTEGKAGTIQEIFQDSTQNYYETFGKFSPMVFLGKDYWTNQYPVQAVLKKLFKPEHYQTKLLFTDSIEEIPRFLISHS